MQEHGAKQFLPSARRRLVPARREVGGKHDEEGARESRRLPQHRGQGGDADPVPLGEGSGSGFKQLLAFRRLQWQILQDMHLALVEQGVEQVALVAQGLGPIGRSGWARTHEEQDANRGLRRRPGRQERQQQLHLPGAGLGVVGRYHPWDRRLGKGFEGGHVFDRGEDAAQPIRLFSPLADLDREARLAGPAGAADHRAGERRLTLQPPDQLVAQVPAGGERDHARACSYEAGGRLRVRWDRNGRAFQRNSAGNLPIDDVERRAGGTIDLDAVVPLHGLGSHRSPSSINRRCGAGASRRPHRHRC